MIARRELAPGRAIQDEGKQNQSAKHVRAVEACHREERAGESVRGQVQAAAERVDELVQLAELESKSQDNRRDHEHEKSPPVVAWERFEGEVARHTAGLQDGRVDERDWPPADVVLGSA